MVGVGHNAKRSSTHLVVLHHLDGVDERDLVPVHLVVVQVLVAELGHGNDDVGQVGALHICVVDAVDVLETGTEKVNTKRNHVSVLRIHF